MANNIYTKLAAIQAEMKVPKDLYNSFGGYHYRNAETIQNAYKPLGIKYGTALMIDDLMEQVGEWHYVTARATLVNCENPEETITVAASAREPAVKKGMDDCQITGAASSYARKYALNGLFLLDDTKDADSEEYRNETAARAKGQAQSQPRTQQKSQQQKQQSPAQAKNYEGPKVTPEHLADIKNAMMAAGIPEATICKAYKVGTMESLPDVMYEAIMGRIKATVQQKAKQQPANGGWTGGGAA